MFWTYQNERIEPDMPIYEYNGFNERGKAVRGLKESDSAKSVRVLLRKDGILATDVHETKSARAAKRSVGKVITQQRSFKRLFDRISIEALGVATRQLATLLQAGVPLIEGLAALIEQVDSQRLKEVFSNIRSEVNEGSTLADAMAKHKCFSNVYVNMVRAGETSGTLEIVLERLADFTEGQAQLNNKIMGALLYPAVMVMVAGAVLVIMFTVVVPKITKIFETANVKLPLATRVLIGTSDLMRSYWWLMFMLMVAGTYLLLRYLKTQSGRSKWDRLRLRLPIVGNILRLIIVSRFSRTLATLLSSGVPLLSALHIVRNVVANVVFEEVVDRVKDAVQEGEDIATPLKRSGQFPPMLTHMVAIGERTGQLESMLNRVAEAYEQRVEVRVGMLTGLLEPIMILTMGGTVGFIVMAILMPIMQMSQLVK